MIMRHEDTLGPYIDWREHSLFNNSQFPQQDLTEAAHVHICQVSTLIVKGLLALLQSSMSHCQLL